MVERNNPLYYEAYMKIKKNILSGHYQLGEKLSNAGLAKELGFSHTPVREAVQTLIHEGLLYKEHNRGITVFNPSLQDIAEVYSFRASLEGVAASLAALLDSESEKKKYLLFLLSEELHKSEIAKANGDFQKVAESNIEFHDYILNTCENKSLKDVLNPLRSKSMLLRYGSLKMEYRMEVAIKEHQKIFEMIRDGRSIEVEYYMKKHILAAGFRIIEQYSESEDDSNIYAYMKERVLINFEEAEK